MVKVKNTNTLTRLISDGCQPPDFFNSSKFGQKCPLYYFPEIVWLHKINISAKGFCIKKFGGLVTSFLTDKCLNTIITKLKFLKIYFQWVALISYRFLFFSIT